MHSDSKLTRLTSEALGGVCKTSFIATITPALSELGETMSTLRYAKNAMEALNISQVSSCRVSTPSLHHSLVVVVVVVFVFFFYFYFFFVVVAAIPLSVIHARASSPLTADAGACDPCHCHFASSLLPLRAPSTHALV